MRGWPCRCLQQVFGPSLRHAGKYRETDMADSTVLTQSASSGSETPGKVESSGSETLPRSDSTLYETLPTAEPTTPWWMTSVGRALLLLLVLLGFGYTLFRFSQALMLPIVLALLLAIILAPMVRLLRKLFCAQHHRRRDRRRDLCRRCGVLFIPGKLRRQLAGAGAANHARPGEKLYAS